MPQNLIDKQLLERSPQTGVLGTNTLARATQDEIMAKLDKLDFNLIGSKLINPDEGEGWSLERTNRAIALYKMFLCLLYLYPHLEIVPSLEIDKIWHQHILDTVKYAQDCQHIFGTFVHHFPYFGLGGEEARQKLNAAFVQTQLLFINHFGVDIIADSQPSACIELLENQQKQIMQPSPCVELFGL